MIKKYGIIATLIVVFSMQLQGQEICKKKLNDVIENLKIINDSVEILNIINKNKVIKLYSLKATTSLLEYKRCMDNHYDILKNKTSIQKDIKKEIGGIIFRK